MTGLRTHEINACHAAAGTYYHFGCVSLSFSTLPQGIVLKDLKPEHAELVAKNYEIKDWFTELSPYEAKRQFIDHLIRNFIGIGAFLTEDPSEPIAWNFRKPGIYLGQSKWSLFGVLRVIPNWEGER